MDRKFRILSLDGGGLRGLAQLRVLKKIELLTGKKIYELFDLISGTSTGGIIACGLTAGKDGKPLLTVDQLIELYSVNAGKIFPEQNTILKKWYRSIRSTVSSKFSEEGLDELLKEYFKDAKLSETIKPILVPSYDVYHNEVVMFKSRYSDNIENDVTLRDVCRATSAAPTYLPPFEMNYMNVDRLMIDGGVYVNNPTMAIIADALKYKYGRDSLNLEDIQILSIGSGLYSEKISPKRDNWGIIKWGPAITTVMVQASAKAVEYECAQLPLDKFLRLQFILDEESRSDMSDSRHETLKYITNCVNDQIINKRLDEIKNFFNMK
jgi:patatin-like phospholipase/acyl hydrolase